MGVAPHAVAGDLHLPRSTMDTTVLGTHTAFVGFVMHLCLLGNYTQQHASTTALWTPA